MPIILGPMHAQARIAAEYSGTVMRSPHAAMFCTVVPVAANRPDHYIAAQASHAGRTKEGGRNPQGALPHVCGRSGSPSHAANGAMLGRSGHDNGTAGS